LLSCCESEEKMKSLIFSLFLVVGLTACAIPHAHYEPVPRIMYVTPYFYGGLYNPYFYFGTSYYAGWYEYRSYYFTYRAPRQWTRPTDVTVGTRTRYTKRQSPSNVQDRTRRVVTRSSPTTRVRTQPRQPVRRVVVRRRKP
jgi:hypothetical protein